MEPSPSPSPKPHGCFNMILRSTDIKYRRTQACRKQSGSRAKKHNFPKSSPHPVGSRSTATMANFNKPAPFTMKLRSRGKTTRNSPKTEPFTMTLRSRAKTSSTPARAEALKKLLHSRAKKSPASSRAGASKSLLDSRADISTTPSPSPLQLLTPLATPSQASSSKFESHPTPSPSPSPSQAAVLVADPWSRDTTSTLSDLETDDSTIIVDTSSLEPRSPRRDRIPAVPLIPHVPYRAVRVPISKNRSATLSIGTLTTVASLKTKGVCSKGEGKGKRQGVRAKGKGKGQGKVQEEGLEVEGKPKVRFEPPTKLVLKKLEKKYPEYEILELRAACLIAHNSGHKNVILKHVRKAREIHNWGGVRKNSWYKNAAWVCVR